MRDEVRRLLREENEAFWTNNLLLDLFNQQMDLRGMELADRHEGWMTQLWQTDIVAGTPAYAVPEGTGRIKRVMMVLSTGTANHIVPLVRAERWSESWVDDAARAVGSMHGTVPTYRLVSEFIVLEPTPTVSNENGLRADLENLPQRIQNDGERLDTRFPPEMETLLIYDTAVAALAVEGTQGNVNEAWMDHLLRMRSEYAVRFAEFSESRTEGRTFGQPYRLGD